MMDIQLRFEHELNSPTAFFHLLPFMKWYPSKVMKVTQELADHFGGYVHNNIKEYNDSYNPGEQVHTSIMELNDKYIAQI